MAVPQLSIVMASKNRSALLARTLESIRSQRVPFPYEIIVVDDGSADDTRSVCDHFSVRYFRTERAHYTNPGFARNIGYRAARGDIIIAQSDDTYHETKDSVERLATVKVGEFHLATVWELNQAGERVSQYVGDKCQRPLFFLGSLLRDDLYAIGGDDEDFDMPGYEDDWFAARLIRGRGLTPIYRADVVGCHQWHARPSQEDATRFCNAMAPLCHRKMDEAARTGVWVSSSGPWPAYEEAV